MSAELSVGFIGLGNVGAKLAGSILRAGEGLTVLDLDSEAEAPFARRWSPEGGEPESRRRSVGTPDYVPAEPRDQRFRDGRARWRPFGTVTRQYLGRDEYHRFARSSETGQKGEGARGLAGGLSRFGRVPPRGPIVEESHGAEGSNE